MTRVRNVASKCVNREACTDSVEKAEKYRGHWEYLGRKNFKE
jgi:hypothetical protein